MFGRISCFWKKSRDWGFMLKLHGVAGELFETPSKKNRHFEKGGIAGGGSLVGICLGEAWEYAKTLKNNFEEWGSYGCYFQQCLPQIEFLGKICVNSSAGKIFGNRRTFANKTPERLRWDGVVEQHVSVCGLASWQDPLTKHVGWAQRYFYFANIHVFQGRVVSKAMKTKNTVANDHVFKMSRFATKHRNGGRLDLMVSF